jgi:crotonobetainyl-CoA:carnitine CoA-transferase CaiB-like acyl-CoA transferase
VSEVLSGARIVVFGSAVAGLVAMARLRELGADVHKIETDRAAFLESASPAWYSQLHDGIESTIADIATAAGRAVLDARLAGADVLLTSGPSAELAERGYGWESLARRFPRLAHVAIGTDGYGLTLLARAGLLDPAALPRALFVECAAAERAVSATLCALYAAARGMPPTRASVSLEAAAESLALPLRNGLTAPGAILGGGFAGYGVYRCADGFVALAACESPFFDRVCDALLGSGTYGTFEAAFASQTASYWERVACAAGFPLAALTDRSDSKN